jgi:hypothetical protein
VLALTAHIAAYQQGRRGWMPCGVIWKRICTISRGIKQRFSETELAAAGGDLSGLD